MIGIGKKIRFMFLTALLLALGMGVSACGDSSDGASSGGTGGSDSNADAGTLSEHPVVELDIEGMGKITLELDTEAAPLSTANFVKLVDEGFYDGLTFHRVIKDFMIQGGDPAGNGTGGSEETVQGEFASNGWENPISHVRGVISMARAADPNSGSSQFFIVHADSTYLDGEYAAFGKVTSGMDVVDEIASVETGANDLPVTPVVIKSAKVISY